jgi:hypothetical protein
MPEPINNPTNTPTPAATPGPAPEQTFTQAEVDALIGKRLAKAMKGMPSEEELSAYRAWKESQQTEKDRMDTLTRERNESKSALASAQAELEQLKREKLLLNKGVPTDDVDYYAFKIGKLVTDSKDFEKAAEEYFKDKDPGQKVRVEMTAPLGGNGSIPTANDAMNALIRGARK